MLEKGVIYEYFKGEPLRKFSPDRKRVHKNNKGTVTFVSEKGNWYKFRIIICKEEGCCKVRVGKKIRALYCAEHHEIRAAAKRLKQSKEAYRRKRKPAITDTERAEKISAWWDNRVDNPEQADKTKDNCKHRLQCLPKHVNKSHMPCKCCEDYLEADIEGMFYPGK